MFETILKKNFNIKKKSEEDLLCSLFRFLIFIVVIPQTKIMFENESTLAHQVFNIKGKFKKHFG